MPIDITINDITGLTPYDVYICDTGMTTCIYVETITSGDIPYTFQVPVILESLTNFKLKVVDDNECVITEILSV